MIRIGTSGFSYDDWKGYFYPPGMKKKDMLAFYSRQFDTVEINSSYYAIPGAASFAAMAAKSPDNFEFVVKAHKDMTHTSDRPDVEIFEIFAGSVLPLREAGKFGCVLAQFPWSFRCTPQNSDRLCEFRDRVGDLPAVVEFRNSEWVNDDTFGLLRELGLGFCCVDEPQLKGLMPPVTAATSGIAYVRFHGRNYAKWWQHDSPHERYDYRYSEEELAEWVPRVTQLQQGTSKTYLFFNNHFQGKSADNARSFARMLGKDLPFVPPGDPDGQMTLGEGM